MAHLIKLESGDYLNLDNLVCIVNERLNLGERTFSDGDHYTVIINAYMTTDKAVTLSPKDLEKIEKIAKENS